jgi:hypothetical protein
MTRSRKAAAPATSLASSAPVADDIMQIKVWLLGVSPMVWRRVLVPATLTLRELHGVIGSYGGEGQKTAIRAFKSPIRNSNC